MAMRPCSERICPFSSNTLTTKTVLEKLNAKAINKDIAERQTGLEGCTEQGERTDQQPEKSNNNSRVQARDGPHLRSSQRSKIEF